MKKINAIVLLMMLCVKVMLAQQNEIVYPEVGKPCPDFVLRNIRYYHKNQATLNDFSGKLLILDFWNKACGACVASFPKTNALQRKFKNDVQFMLVGIADKEGQIEPMYAKFKEKEKLEIPCAFDSLLAKRWDIYTAPYIIAVDENKIVRAISYSVDSSDIIQVLNGETPRLAKIYRMHEEEIDTRIPYDKKRPFLIDGNGGKDTAFLFRSILAAYNGFEQHYLFPDSIDEDAKNGRFQVLGAPLYWLYNYAYYGVPHPNKMHRDEPVLEIRDSTLFQYSPVHNMNLFSYSLILPKSKAEKRKMKVMMQGDLKNYFGYEVVIEDRKFPCLKMIATKEAGKMIKTKGGPESFRFIIPKADFIAQNWPFNKMFRAIANFNDMEILDETGIIGNIDIQMHCLLTDTEDVKKALQEHGLDLVPSQISKKVLVIRDLRP